MSKPNPFRLARVELQPFQERILEQVSREPAPTILLAPDRSSAPRRERKPQVDLETIRVLLYLSTSPRLTRAHRDACRQAAELLR